MKTRAKIGQLVRLRAGGPVLCVIYEHLLDDGSYCYFCQWFEYETLRHATFPILALEPVEGEFEAVIKDQPSTEAEAESEEAEAEAEAEEHNSGKNYH